MKLLITTKRAFYCFVASIIFQSVALILINYDPVDYGLGVLTLTVSPLLLLIGLILPAIGLASEKYSIKKRWKSIKSTPLISIGFILSVLISFITYLLTLEPTASLWDCSETIAAAYKLQVPHTPGTPLTLLIAKIFSMLSMGDVMKVAWFINLMSAVFSSLTIGIVYLMISHFGKKLTSGTKLLFFGSLGGSLCLTFSDSFWFSAVEAETYAPSVFFMMLLIWQSTVGKKLEGLKRKQKILQLAYLLGLSYCIHPMCILVLPVCFFIWRSKSRTNGWKHAAVSFFIGVLWILIISKVIAVDFFEWAFKFDLLLVNNWSLPFYSGVILLITLLIPVFIFIWQKFERSRLVLSILIIIILGFAPYLMLFTRSARLPSINEFSPGNLAKIKPYMNRESYPSRPLLYGPYFDTKIIGSSSKASSYVAEGNYYRPVGEVPAYEYDKHRMTLLPRMYSNEPAHIQTYQQWTDLSKGEKPGFSENLEFMFKYQLGHMYGRYLMWNFSGRASDIQHATWLIPQDGIADRSQIGYSKATNQYFMLPLIIGLIGMIVQLKKDKVGFTANLGFFLITGLLLAIYLNATPNEPRERDYIYVGSYVSFCVWIGLGFISILRIIKSSKIPTPFALILLVVPLWMFYQNLDDHDRSGRTYQIDHARNVLASCEEGAILFTGGDNDTFPLWYLQEVEGFRTDVRVKVMSYFNADWYINQLSRQYYDSPSFQLTLKKGRNEYGPYNAIYVYEKTSSPILWDKYLLALQRENPSLLLENSTLNKYYYLPSRTIIIPTSQGDLTIKVNGSYLSKSELAILDVVYSNNLERPVYFNFTGMNSLNIDLRKYLIQEGLVYKLTAKENAEQNPGMDIERTYENLVVKADYRNLGNENIYFNHEDYNARMVVPTKFAMNSLIEAYLQNGNLGKAEEVISFALNNLYHNHLESSYADLQLAIFMKGFQMTEASEYLVNRTFQFFYEKIGRQLKFEESYSRNDLLILQEAARLSGDQDMFSKFQGLAGELGVR